MLKKIYIKNAQIVTRKIMDETILVPIRGKLADMKRIFTLNSVSDYIWDNLDGKRTLEDILISIVDHFEVETDMARSDLLEFTDDLVKEGLITEVL